jgi:hypothetical protein
MGERFDSILRVLARLFRGRVRVREVGFPLREAPEIRSSFRRPEVRPIRPEGRVIAARFFEWNHARPKTAGALLGRSPSVPKRVELVARASVPRGGRIGLVAPIREAGGLMRRLPLSRRNRVAYLRDEARPKDVFLLALYAPILRGRLRRVALNKKEGILLLWLDAKGDPKEAPQALALCRRRLPAAQPEWVWLSPKSSAENALPASRGGANQTGGSKN